MARILACPVGDGAYPGTVCGRYAQLADLDDLEEVFDVSRDDVAADVDPTPRYNAAPTQPLPVVLPRGDDAPRRLAAMRWGIAPGDPKRIGRSTTINARSENLFRRRGRMAEAFRKRRCVVPASGFYEWAAADAGGRRGRRVPHFVHRRDERPFGFAGVWADTEGPGGGVWRGFAIVTVPALGIVADLHDRMPAILAGPDAVDRWLDPELHDPEPLVITLGGPDDRRRTLEAFEAYRVGAAVGSPDVEGPELVAPYVRDDGPLFDAVRVDPDRGGP